MQEFLRFICLDQHLNSVHRKAQRWAAGQISGAVTVPGVSSFLCTLSDGSGSKPAVHEAGS